MKDLERCSMCRREVEVVDGEPTHRLPRPASDLRTVGAQIEWGHELGLFTLATAGHEARVG